MNIKASELNKIASNHLESTCTSGTHVHLNILRLGLDVFIVTSNRYFFSTLQTCDSVISFLLERVGTPNVAWYSGGTQLRSRPKTHLFRQRHFVIFLTPSRRMPRHCHQHHGVSVLACSGYNDVHESLCLRA
jgi:hypothetical protein